MIEISPEELKQQLKEGRKLVLIDVREPDEYEICHLEKAKLIPMKEIPQRFAELNSKDDIVLYCHHGMRSAQAALWLQQKGFQNVKSLKGGIHEWAIRIDPEMNRY